MVVVLFVLRTIEWFVRTVPSCSRQQLLLLQQGAEMKRDIFRIGVSFRIFSHKEFTRRATQRSRPLCKPEKAARRRTPPQLKKFPRAQKMLQFNFAQFCRSLII